MKCKDIRKSNGTKQMIRSIFRKLNIQGSLGTQLSGRTVHLHMLAVAYEQVTGEDRKKKFGEQSEPKSVKEKNPEQAIGACAIEAFAGCAYRCLVSGDAMTLNPGVFS